MELYKKYKSLFEKYKVDTPLRISHFLAQVEHESGGFKRLEENLNYSIEGLIKIFPKYFTISQATEPNKAHASQYARKPEKIANLIYANRMGNGDEKSGDGWKYKGAGFIQLTGKSNYQLLTKDTDLDFIKSPALLLEEPNAILAALWFWSKNNINKYADNDDIKGVTKAINGGQNGLHERELLLAKYKKGL